jgi:hypothetical protein
MSKKLLDGSMGILYQCHRASVAELMRVDLVYLQFLSKFAEPYFNTAD